jgi:hypothetical protein
MVDAPRQNWAAYEAAVRPHELERLRRMTPAEKFALYSSLHRFLTRGRIGTSEWEKLEAWRWKKKVRLRRRMVEGYQKLDEYLRERAARQGSS